MILNHYVSMIVNPNNITRLRSLGYVVPDLGRQGAGRRTIRVSVSHLLPKSNAKVSCRCDSCSKKFMSMFRDNTDTCYPCFGRNKMLGNNFGSANKGKQIPSMQGDKHPRWNPNTPEFKKYAGRVHYQTKRVYEANKGIINPLNFPRTLCGVEGGFQLDHKVSVKEGFDRKLPIHEIAHINNLQMLSWKENRNKGD